MPSTTRATKQGKLCQTLEPDNVAGRASGDEALRKGKASGQCIAAVGRATACVVVSSALVELLQAAQLQAAMVAALAPAILPPAGLEALTLISDHSALIPK